MNLCLLYENPSENIENLSQVFKFLENSDLFNEISELGSPSKLKSAIKKWNGVEIEEEVKSLLEVRNYLAAHLIPKKQPEPPPPYKNLYKVLQHTVPIVEDLAAGFGVNMNSFDEAIKIHERKVNNFWANFQFSPPTKTMSTDCS